MSTLTIIPAKIGSTRLPNKNIRELLGKPLLNYAIEAASVGTDAVKFQILNNEKMVPSGDVLFS